MTDTRIATSYLKGVVILVVMVNHYVNAYVSEQYNGYGFVAISLMFVLSGYGIFYSLEKQFSGTNINLKGSAFFLLKRVLRILPLYWLALAASSVIFSESYSIGAYLLNPLRKAPGHFWFITAIFPCYLLSIPSYYLFRKIGQKLFLITICVSAAACYILLYFAGGAVAASSLVRIYWLLTYFFLFCGGMYIASVNTGTKEGATGLYRLIISAVMFIVLLIAARNQFVSGALEQVWIILLFAASACYFCHCFLSAKKDIILIKAIVLVGTYSYSVYLFHICYYKILSMVGLIKEQSVLSAALTVVLFPLFFILCIGIEKASGIIVKKLIVK